MPQPDTAVAVHEERHPIIAQIDARMTEIAEILPDGMRPDRFRKVVVQALLRNPDLWACTPISVVTAITEAAEVGIEPTGVLGKGWLLPYNIKVGNGVEKQAKFIPGWRGFVDLCWKADRLLLTPEVVRAGDAFEYRRGTDAFLHHVPILDDPEREASDANITFAYVVVRFPDGREDFEVMARAAIDRIAGRAKYKNPVWSSDLGEMAKKSTIRRIAKRLPLSPAVQVMLGRDEETDFDTPVERVADPKHDDLRDRISARSAALRGEPTESGEPEASVPTGGAEPEGDDRERADTSRSREPSGGSPRKGDPWMARLHAVANERGMDHGALHDWAGEHFHVESLTDLSTPQRATFMELVERMPVLEQPSSGVPTAPADGEAEVPRASVSPTTPSSDSGQSEAATTQLEPPPVPAASAPTLDDVLAVTGGEEIPAKPGSDSYRALPAQERASARAYWQEHGESSRPDAEQLRTALGAGA